MMEISEYPRNTWRWLFDFSFTVGKPEVFGLKAIQDPQGESRGRGCCRYPSPDKNPYTHHPVNNGEIFIEYLYGRYEWPNKSLG